MAGTDPGDDLDGWLARLDAADRADRRSDERRQWTKLAGLLVAVALLVGGIGAAWASQGCPVWVLGDYQACRR